MNDAYPIRIHSRFIQGRESIGYFTQFKKAESFLLTNSTARTLHNHDYYQFELITKGRILHGNSANSEILGEGDSFIIPPGTPHFLTALEENTYTYTLLFYKSLLSPNVSFNVAYDFLEHLDHLYSSGDSDSMILKVPIPQSSMEDLQFLLDVLIKEAALPLDKADSMAPSLISCILTILKRVFPFPSANDIKARNETLNYALACIDYINQNYMLHIKEPELASQFNISVSTLTKMFNSLLGMGFNEYLNRKRIENAADLMRSSSMSITQIAYAVGYSDTTTFFRNFKACMKVSPTEYRRSL